MCCLKSRRKPYVFAFFNFWQHVHCQRDIHSKNGALHIDAKNSPGQRPTACQILSTSPEVLFLRIMDTFKVSLGEDRRLPELIS